MVPPVVAVAASVVAVVSVAVAAVALQGSEEEEPSKDSAPLVASAMEQPIHKKPSRAGDPPPALDFFVGDSLSMTTASRFLAE
jgi:hypothetical protein